MVSTDKTNEKIFEASYCNYRVLSLIFEACYSTGCHLDPLWGRVEAQILAIIIHNPHPALSHNIITASLKYCSFLPPKKLRLFKDATPSWTFQAGAKRTSLVSSYNAMAEDGAL